MTCIILVKEIALSYPSRQILVVQMERVKVSSKMNCARLCYNIHAIFSTIAALQCLNIYKTKFSSQFSHVFFFSQVER